MPADAQLRPPERWQIDRKVPIAIIIMLTVQTAGALWWAARITTQVEQVQKELAERSPIVDRFLTIEERVNGIGPTILRIEEKLDRVIEQRRSELASPLAPSTARP